MAELKPKLVWWFDGNEAKARVESRLSLIFTKGDRSCCGRAPADDDRFCTKCGKELPPTQKVPRGSRIEGGLRCIDLSEVPNVEELAKCFDIRPPFAEPLQRLAREILAFEASAKVLGYAISPDAWHVVAKNELPEVTVWGWHRLDLEALLPEGWDESDRPTPEAFDEAEVKARRDLVAAVRRVFGEGIGLAQEQALAVG